MMDKDKNKAQEHQANTINQYAWIGIYNAHVEHQHIYDVSKSNSHAEEKSTAQADQSEQHNTEDKKLNLNTPYIVLRNMLQEDWFNEVCTDKKLYNEGWRNRFVTDFMASEYGIYMAKLWNKNDRRDKTKGEFLGALVDGGVLKENKLSIARSYLGIDKNTRDDDEKKQANTFANYVGQGKNQPYAAWVKEYVNKIKTKK